MAVIKAVHSKAKLNVAVNYITKKEKTRECLVSGIHCSPESAVHEMETTKRLWHKTSGRQYDHYIQSFAPNELVSSEQAHQLARQWAEHLFPDYECLVATHVDRDHIHSHIIVNSVNYHTGKKIHTSAHWLQEAKNFSDYLCREDGLSVCEKGKTFEGQIREDSTSWKKEEYHLLEKSSNGKAKSFILDIAIAVCTVLKSATSRNDFVERLLEYGIATMWTDSRKYITFADLEGNKIRNKKLSQVFHVDFSKEALEYEFAKRSREKEKHTSADSNNRRKADATSSRLSERPNKPTGSTAPEPQSLTERLKWAAERVQQRTQESDQPHEQVAEKYLSVDDLFSEGILPSDYPNQAVHKKHQQSLEL